MDKLKRQFDAALTGDFGVQRKNCPSAALCYVLFARLYKAMDKSDRIRACYQHCVLQWVLRKKMSNQSMRERFGNTVSQIISAAAEQGLIKNDPTAPDSRKYARYIPVWA